MPYLRSLRGLSKPAWVPSPRLGQISPAMATAGPLRLRTRRTAMMNQMMHRSSLHPRSSAARRTRQSPRQELSTPPLAPPATPQVAASVVASFHVGVAPTGTSASFATTSMTNASARTRRSAPSGRVASSSGETGDFSWRRSSCEARQRGIRWVGARSSPCQPLQWNGGLAARSCRHHRSSCKRPTRKQLGQRRWHQGPWPRGWPRRLSL
mmetsp:Transcript_54307/g.126447  ORF Transcript_54307/g.126447 Transcript_54307/m.126447 type:complete len:210 (-) Transcript_54307:485-1114(-)